MALGLLSYQVKRSVSEGRGWRVVQAAADGTVAGPGCDGRSAAREQEGRFFHGYYDCYCYLPLYIFCGEQLLCSRLRTSDQDGAAGSVEELERIVGQLRARWPEVRVVIRADSGFCREDIMAWCEQEEVQVDYVLGLARNSRLEAALSADMEAACEEHERTGEAVRRFGEFSYQTRSSWSRARRVIGKAEHLRRGANPRFVVTSLSAEEVAAQELYEEKYCARGDMENRIKEQQLDLFADRTSSHQMAANQLRLYFASFAYELLEALRRLGAKGTRLARAQSGTLRLKLIKVGVRIRVTTRRVWLSMSAGYPHAEVFAEVLGNLTRLRPADLHHRRHHLRGHQTATDVVVSRDVPDDAAPEGGVGHAAAPGSGDLVQCGLADAAQADAGDDGTGWEKAAGGARGVG